MYSCLIVMNSIDQMTYADYPSKEGQHDREDNLGTRNDMNQREGGGNVKIESKLRYTVCMRVIRKDGRMVVVFREDKSEEEDRSLMEENSWKGCLSESEEESIHLPSSLLSLNLTHVPLSE